VKLAASEWCKSGLDKVVVETIETRYYDLLHKQGLDLIVPKDVAAVLGIERQRQMMGCTEEASCLAEIGGALGVDAVLYGCVVRAGSGFTVTLRAVGTRTAKPVVSYSQRLPSEDALQDWMDSSAKLMGLELRQALGGEALTEQIDRASADLGSVTSTVAPAPSPWRKPAWISVAVAGVGLGLMLGGLLGSSATLSELNAELAEQRQVTPRAEGLATRGSTLQTIGWVGAAVAGAGAVAAIVFFLLPTKKGPSPAVFVGPQGAVVGVVALLP
jgi:hypothetical protein